MHACPQTKHRYEYLAANDTHRDQCHTQYQTNPPRHGFLGGSSQELAAACAASADLAAQRRGSPGRTPSSRSCPRAAAEAPVPCTRRHSSKERRKKLAPGPRAASARSAGVNGMPPWRLLIFEVISRTVVVQSQLGSSLSKPVSLCDTYVSNRLPVSSGGYLPPTS